MPHGLVPAALLRDCHHEVRTERNVGRLKTDCALVESLGFGQTSAIPGQGPKVVQNQGIERLNQQCIAVALLCLAVSARSMQDLSLIGRTCFYAVRESSWVQCSHANHRDLEATEQRSHPVVTAAHENT